MSKPKRHHWWPLAQSKYWTDIEGLVFVTRADGSVFRANPINIGVESELYTRFVDGNVKDTSIEEWFAEAIDDPAKKMIEHLLDPSNIRREVFYGDPAKTTTLKTLGFRVDSYVDVIRLPSDIRDAIISYLAALLVRHPSYLMKLRQFHEENAVLNGAANAKALDNMLHLFRVYEERIRRSMFIVSRRVGSSEYVYSDGGLVVEEPWRDLHGLPFDIHAPITPDLAIEVLPLPLSVDLTSATIMEATNQGVARQNRIALSSAKRFVFSRQIPPSKFINANFGKSAPKNIGYRFINGRLETRYDPDRE